jgi:hypothetical protein
VLSRALLLLAGALTLVATTTGCTGLTKPESIAIIADPAPEPAAPKPGSAQAAAAAPGRVAPVPAPAPQPEQAGCGE